MSYGFCHVEIPTTDLGKAGGFYAEVFDWKVEYTPNMDYANIDTGSPPPGGLTPVEEVRGGGLTVYILADDIEAVLARITNSGGKVIQGKTEISGVGSVGLFSDPDGNILGLFTPPTQEE